MKTYDLYGLPSGDIEIVRQAIEAALGVKLVPHDSSFIGEYYSGSLKDEVFEIWGNIDPVDGELHNDTLPPTGILIHVGETGRPSEIQDILMAKIPGLLLLKRKEH